MAGRFSWGAAALAAVAVGLVSVAAAQQPTEEETATEPPAEAGNEEPKDASATLLDPITVTATRNPIKAFEYPGMVTVIGREEIQLRQASTPDDVLQFVPNVEFTGGPRRNGEVPSIRGFDGADIVVLVDGARQNFGSAHDGRFFVDPSLIRQVEVLRGPASALYGSGGTGGVIEFRTVEAGDFLQQGETFGTTISSGFQSVNDERSGTLTTYAIPIEGLDVVASVTKRDSGVIDQGDGNEVDNTDDDILAALGKVGWSFAEHHKLEGSFIRFGNDAEEPNNGQDFDGDDIVDKRIANNTWRGTYSYKNPADNLFDLDLTAYYTTFKADEERLDDNGAGPAGEQLTRNVDTIGLRLDNRSRLQLSQDVMVTFTYGGEAYRDDQEGEAGGDDREGVPDAEADFFGIFGQLELAIAEPFGVIPGDFLIIPGLRYDRYDSDSVIDDAVEEDKLSPRFGVSYLPTEWSLVFANYAQAFRAPTFDELYQTGVHFPVGGPFNNFFIPNPDLKPQKTETVEFGGGFDFDDILQGGDRFQVKTSYFRIWSEDFIDVEVIQPGFANGTTQNVNVEDARLWGAEVEGSYESTRALLTFGYSTIDGRNDNDNEREKLGVLTPDQFTVNAALKLPEIDSIVGWRSIIARDFSKVDEPEDERDGYVVNDIYFAWQPVEGLLSGLRIDLGIDNLFDETYARVSSNSKEAGRNFKASVSYSLTW